MGRGESNFPFYPPSSRSLSILLFCLKPERWFPSFPKCPPTLAFPGPEVAEEITRKTARPLPSHVTAFCKVDPFVFFRGDLVPDFLEQPSCLSLFLASISFNAASYRTLSSDFLIPQVSRSDPFFLFFGDSDPPS